MKSMLLCLDYVGCQGPSLHCASASRVTAAVTWNVSLCQASRKGFLFFCSCPLSLPFPIKPPFPYHVAGSFALLVGSDLRTGYSEDRMEKKNFSFHCIPWQEPSLLGGQMASGHLEMQGKHLFFHHILAWVQGLAGHLALHRFTLWTFWSCTFELSSFYQVPVIFSDTWLLVARGVQLSNIINLVSVDHMSGQKEGSTRRGREVFHQTGDLPWQLRSSAMT